MKSEQKTLIRKYEKLPPSSQAVLQLLAVKYAPINRTALVPLVQKAGVKDAAGRALDYKGLKPCLDSWIKEGLVEFARGKGPIQLNRLIADHVFRDVFFGASYQQFNAAASVDGGNNSFLWSDMAYNKVTKSREAFYEGDIRKLKSLSQDALHSPMLLTPFSAESFARLPAASREFFAFQSICFVIAGVIADVNADLDLGAFGCLIQSLEESLEKNSTNVAILLDVYIAQGDIKAIEMLQKRVPDRAELAATVAFLEGDYDAALVHFETGLKQLRKRTKQRTAIFKYLPSFLYSCLLLKQNTAESLKKLKTLLNKIDKWDNDFYLLSLVLKTAAVKRSHPMSPVEQIEYAQDAPHLMFVAQGWSWRWCFIEDSAPFELVRIQRAAKHYRIFGLHFLADECEAIALLFNKKSKKAPVKKQKKNAVQSQPEGGAVSLLELIPPEPKWSQALSAIESLVAGVKDAGASSAQPDQPLHDERMVWELSGDCSLLTIEPYIQKFNKKGWTKGRKVALSRLYHDPSQFEFLTEKDRAICKSIREEVEQNYYGYRESFLYFEPTGLAKAIVGHPLVFNPNDRQTPIEITQSQPGLVIEKSKSHLRFSVTPAAPEGPIGIIRESAHRISVIEFSRQQRELAEVVSAMPPVPADQFDRVADMTNALSSIIAVQSDVESTGTNINSKSVDSDSSIVIQLTPWQDGLRAELFIRPLGADGPLCRPGQGAINVIATVGGKPVAARRDLDAERANFTRVLSLSQQLDTRTVSNDQTEWLFHETEEALELVTELHAIAPQENVTVLWPRGKSHDVAGQATVKQFKVSVKRDKDWFAASGKLKVDDQLTLDMMDLLELVADSPSRFLKLDDGRFVALTTELRKRIGEVAAFSSIAKNKVRFAPVRALAMEELIDATNSKTDKHWKDHVKRIEESGTLKTAPPTTLQAELRDYQQEGFGWLKRLAHWNSGACLADDMGLGKTIQAIALAIERAPDGPALVVAPASVGFSWESEIHKFAPTLTPKLFRSMDRDQFFKELQPGDVAIASYGLMQSEIKRFEKVEFNTILLDEAQAIKNMETKRSQAVMRLQGSFRVVLTGTPLENHLGEMWNLFRFVTPGLLGSDKEFRQQFAVPIERDQCRESRQRLRKLIQPFLLRRTKTEVLSELPARTESLLEVELSPEEVALYEAIRIKALEKLSEQPKDDSKKGQQHLQVLAELTRLRLACCHPSLVGGGSIESSKLKLFRQKIREIIAGRHKVLVFSQFVKHLTILREELDAMGVSYQYLDGSTPTKKRKDIVQAFQSGEGDVFLISLKAGGTGLNLTAADYVIHMDPWWNPAVEDQATDRAHRIGQSRPVNVYRFITKGTIEEKIVALHQSKRALADSLLDGSNIASKMSTEDLLNLLRDE